MKTDNSKLLLFSMLIAGLAIRLYISWLDIEILAEKVISDDAFYNLKIAQNTVSGKGVSFDGISPTNGISDPLYPFFLTPIFKLNLRDVNLPVHLTLTLLSIFNALTAIFIFKIIKLLITPKAALIGTLLWLFNPYVIRFCLGGTGAAIYAFSISVSIYHYLKMKLRDTYTFKNTVILGLLIATTILCRTEGIFLFIAISLDLAYKAFFKPKFSVNILWRVSIYFFTTLLILSPWFIWNLMTFGTIQQTSARAITHLTHSRAFPSQESYSLPLLLVRLAKNINFFIDKLLTYTLGLPMLYILIVGVAFGILLVQLANKNHLKKEYYYKLAYLNFSFLFLIFVIALYSCWLWAFRYWYFLPAILITVIYLSISIHIIEKNIMEFASMRYKKVRLDVVAITFVLLVYGVLGFKISVNETSNLALYQMGIMLRENVPSGSRIGMFESGFGGYFSGKTVINLDGAVNNAAAAAIRNNQFLEYIDEQNLSYIVLDSQIIEELPIVYMRGDNKTNKLLSRLSQVHVVPRSNYTGRGDLVLYRLD